MKRAPDVEPQALGAEIEEVKGATVGSVLIGRMMECSDFTFGGHRIPRHYDVECKYGERCNVSEFNNLSNIDALNMYNVNMQVVVRKVVVDMMSPCDVRRGTPPSWGG